MLNSVNWKIYQSPDERLATQQIPDTQADDGESTEPSEWLNQLAIETFPHDDSAATLLGFAADVEPEWESMIFPDGRLAVLLSSSEDEDFHAEGLYVGYVSIYENVGPTCGPPEPAEFFGIRIIKKDLFDDVDWKEELRGQCIKRFSSLIAFWRRRFFASLLSRHVPMCSKPESKSIDTVVWGPKGQEALGAIEFPMSATLTPETYLLYLSERIEELAEDVDETDMQQISDLLVEAGLLYNPLDPAEPIGRQILLDNEDMQLHLRSLGIPGQMPLRVAKTEQAAETAIRQTGLLAWTLEAVTGLISRYEG